MLGRAAATVEGEATVGQKAGKDVRPDDSSEPRAPRFVEFVSIKMGPETTERKGSAEERRKGEEREKLPGDFLKSPLNRDPHLRHLPVKLPLLLHQRIPEPRKNNTASRRVAQVAIAEHLPSLRSLQVLLERSYDSRRMHKAHVGASADRGEEVEEEAVEGNNGLHLDGVDSLVAAVVLHNKHGEKA